MNIKKLEEIKSNEQVVDMYVKSIDESYNMIGVIGDKISAIMPREEASSIVEEDGLVDIKHIVNKSDKTIQACIKDIITNNDGSILVVVSKKILELKVRRWMYMHLKPGMKLKGVVRGLTEYAAFVDVGGGVTGILKTYDITDINITHAKDKLFLGQRLEVLVKNFDKDTGKIELSYKELLGSFEDRIKKLKEGDIVDGILRNRGKTGVFVELDNDIVGVADHVNGIDYGQKVLVSVKKINIEKQKIKLIIIG